MPPWTLRRITDHLLQSPPFAACTEDRLWSGNVTPRVAYPCRNKPQLIYMLVQALQRYVDTVDLAEYVPSPAQLQRTSQAAVWDVIQLLRGYAKLRKSRRLSPTASAHISSLHAKTLQNYARFLSQVREGLTQEDYAAMAQDLMPSYHQYVLEDAMLRALKQYGPEPKRGAFSTTAMYGAMAEILRHFGIETRAHATVVSRLRKAQQRQRRSA